MTPYKGQTVLYVDEHGRALPAVVTQVWSEETINLSVFTDGSYDFEEAPIVRKTSVVKLNKAGEGNPYWIWTVGEIGE